MNKAVFLDLASVHRDDLDLSALESSASAWTYFEKISEHELAAALSDAEVVVSNKVYLGAEQLQSAKHLRLVCIAATGTNNVDLDAAKAVGVSVCNVRAYATASVVQHVFAMLLSLTTKLESYRCAVRRGDWSRSEHFCLLDYPVRELRGRTLGIVGYGELGKAVANVAEAFGMEVLIAKRNADDDRAGRVGLGELLERVDVLSLHCPLTEDNRGFIGAAQIASMKNDAVLINTARGGLVDEAALLDALANDQLGGAAIDVLEQEPPEEHNPLVTSGLPNLILTPHVAWASVESRQRLLNEIAQNIIAFAEGRARNLVS